MGWRIVEVATDEYMQLYLNNLQINRQGERILINLAEIETLIIQNTRASISINLLNVLVDANVNVIIMNQKHEPGAYVIPVVGHHASLKVLEVQMAWKHEYKALAWQAAIKNKIASQRALLEQQAITYDAPFFTAAQAEVKPYDISNREGHVAKVYWHALFGVSFLRDQKGHAQPIINGMLNYGYAILRSTMIRAIIKKGLDPRLALFHKSPGNYFALASDLMEPLRPLVDAVVLAHQHDVVFTHAAKDELIGVLEQKVAVDGTHFFVPGACDKIVDTLISGRGWAWVDLWG